MNSVPFIPADVPAHAHAIYQKNMEAITHNSSRLFLFACDQKIEHLNDDFRQSALTPSTLFTIASQGRIGAMAAHLGLIARYANNYCNINYIVKLDGRTNSSTPYKRPWFSRFPDANIEALMRDPRNAMLTTVDQVISFRDQTALPIRGIGLTLYLGTAYENEMLTRAAQAIFEAHQQGLIAVLWIYPRGAYLNTKKSAADSAADAAGLANALGADFVKIKPVPNLQGATQAAGNTGVICAGGEKEDSYSLLRTLYHQINRGNVRGCAIGRNIFQRSLAESIALTHAIAALVYDNADLERALVFMQKLS
jgi:DhnA family fructose-bisphosphate aldolase class Ia